MGGGGGGGTGLLRLSQTRTIPDSLSSVYSCEIYYALDNAVFILQQSMGHTVHGFSIYMHGNVQMHLKSTVSGKRSILMALCE